MGEYELVTCASPAYLKKYGYPLQPTDLNQHPALIYDTEPHSRAWPYLALDKQVHVHVKPRLVSNNYKPLLDAAIAGLGIARLPNYVVDAAINAGLLELILTPYYPEKIPIYLLTSPTQKNLPTVRAFIEFMTA